VTNRHLTADEVAAYVDRAVRDEERARIEEHLSGCTPCLDEVAALLRALRFGVESPAAHRRRLRA
jgi:anti-sigma factor RsiW